MDFVAAHLIAEFLLQPEFMRAGRVTYSTHKPIGIKNERQLAEAEMKTYLNDEPTKRYYDFKNLSTNPIGMTPNGMSFQVYHKEHDWKGEFNLLLHALIWMAMIAAALGYLRWELAGIGFAHYILERFDFTTKVISFLKLKVRPSDNYKLVISNVLHLGLLWGFSLLLKL